MYLFYKNIVLVFYICVINNYSIYVGYIKDNVGIIYRVKYGVCYFFIQWKLMYEYVSMLNGIEICVFNIDVYR